MTLRPTEIDGVDAIILPPVRDLGDGFKVRRALPSHHRRMVGPFIFLDQMGPAAFDAGTGLDVRPHPHIGLSTLSFLVEGEIMHRDSLGSLQRIRPGEVNWMTAGRGIVHSERSPDDARDGSAKLLGLQTWVALPTHAEEIAPDFSHHKADDIPFAEDAGLRLTVIAGTLDGMTSPVKTYSDLIEAELLLAPGGRYRLTAEHVERAIYVVSGSVAVEGQTGAFAEGELVVFKPGAEIVLRGESAARVMLVGGEPFPEQRHIFWNFVSSSPERLEQAKADWKADRFDHVPGEHEFIPLPE
ncbi:pirin family protein [Novosphingobium sp. 9]|uniref:pirin family protein n=1 Tax=Novosphingobium sp. 9 TaxID=2025349 RepID=UPI0021B25797|nr:pirin family protein [Novosphingobium sp. 9]